MSEVEQAVEQLRRHQADQKVLVQAREDALALATNPLFKRLILDGFCTVECARYVQESCDPMLAPHMRADALAMAQSAGHLKRFLSLAIQIGNTAANNIQQADGEIANILEHGLEGDE